MGSDESHFSVSLIVRGKVTRQCPQTTTGIFFQAVTLWTPLQTSNPIERNQMLQRDDFHVWLRSWPDVTARPLTFSIRMALGKSRIQNGAGFEMYSWPSFPVFLPKQTHYIKYTKLKNTRKWTDIVWNCQDEQWNDGKIILTSSRY